MDAHQLSDYLNRNSALLEAYARNEFPQMAGRKAIRFIDGNFRAQGWQGRTFMPWKPNKAGTTILVKSGAGRRSINMQPGDGAVRIYTNSPYMRYHNRGFKGTVSVKAFTRNRYTEKQVGTGRYTKAGNERTRTVHELTGSTQVKAHMRKMDLPRRQFMPETMVDCPVLVNSIRREVVKKIKEIFK